MTPQVATPPVEYGSVGSKESSLERLSEVLPAQARDDSALKDDVNEWDPAKAGQSKKTEIGINNPAAGLGRKRHRGHSRVEVPTMEIDPDHCRSAGIQPER
jgi:hypothetical protein